jgi:hypothetical protein
VDTTNLQAVIVKIDTYKRKQYLHDIAPSALVLTVTSGSEVKLESRGSKPFASITIC